MYMLAEPTEQSPTVLAPGTSFMKDNFSTDWAAVGEEGTGTTEDEMARWHH